VNDAFDAMSAWRIETASSNEKNSEQVIEKLAAAARALGWPEQIVDATRAQMQGITKDNGSDDGRLGGADQIAQRDDRLAVGDALEVNVLARRQPGRQLAKRKRVGGNEPHAVLDAMGGAVAESVHRRDGALGQGRSAGLWRGTAPPLNRKSLWSV
jgi:hypothetical protein